MTEPRDDATRVLGSQDATTTGTTGDDATIVVSGAGSAGTATAREGGLLAVGSRIAEFEITRLIGQGGFGAVYEAWDHALERVVAIKEYLPGSLSTRQADGTVVPVSERHRETFELGMRSFINEARLLAQFDHPSLLKVYRFWEANGTTYMVMPLYRGVTLRQALAEQPDGVPEDWLLRIMDGVTQALAVMHGAQCYHRDIAPDNILLLEGSGLPVVLDFGAARRVISDKTQAITVILKPGYAPVEQYAEMPDMKQGPWTDVYALAAVMHVAVCGRSPPPSVARLIADGYVPLAGDAMLQQRYSQRLLSAIDQGLAVRPEHRPPSMAALREALGLEATPTASGHGTTIPMPAAPAAARAGSANAPPRTSPAPQPATSGGTGAGKGRMYAGAGLAALLVAVAAGTWWWLQPTQQAEQPTPPPQVAEPAPDITPPPPEPLPPPPPVAARPRTPLESMQALPERATPGFDVQARPAKAEVRVGQDALSFDVRSARAGHVYVYLLASGGEMFLLFPNLLDKHNRIGAGETLTLPRASWPMEAGGPPGVNHFAVLVSEHERDLDETGLQRGGVFGQFSTTVLSALEAARGDGPTPLLGKPMCPAGNACDDTYGVASFEIVEK